MVKKKGRQFPLAALRYGDSTADSTTPPTSKQEASVSKNIVLRKSGNLIDLSADGYNPLPEDVRHLLEPMLRYTKKKMLYGAERYNPFTGEYDRRVETAPKRCFKYDAHQRLVTNFGFTKRILDTLFTNGYNVEVINRDDCIVRDRPDCYEVDKARILRHFQYRERQEECLQQIIDNPCGIVNAVTGFGKLVVITMGCLMYPKARIDVVTRRATLVNKIADYLTRYIPNVGQFGAGSKSKGRVTVYTAGSLHHSEFDADIVFVDEAHEMLADKSSAHLARYDRARMYALSASPSGRKDGTDIRMEALFGWPIFNLTYKEAVALGLVVPIRVEWSDVLLNTNPCAGLEDVRRKRWGIWQNSERNEIIATKARSFSSNEQVLISVETIEHAVYLWQHLKNEGYVLVYNEMDEGDMRSYKRAKLLPEEFPEMSPKLKEYYRVEFEAGRLKKAISTMWDVGIDPVQLTAHIRADASDSEIADIQAPGRVARRGTKSVGVVCDFLDQFDSNLGRRARSRMRRYGGMGWEQVLMKRDGSVSPVTSY